MPTATIKARFITPCFCGGSDQTESTIRTLSIRGQMRWWYRICGADHKTETALFGSAETGKSPLMVRIGSMQKNRTDSEWKTHNDLKRYLWYFLAQQQRKPIPEDTEFELMLMASDEKTLEKAIAVASVWTTFGALGSRATRAAGCMKLCRVSSDSKALSKFADRINNAANPESLWDVVSPNKDMPFEFRMNEGKTHSDGLGAAEWLATQWKGFRNHKPMDEFRATNIGLADHDDALLASRAKNNSAGKTLRIRRAVLGMPYEQRFRRGSVLVWEGAKGEKFPGMKRMASPIHLRPVQAGSSFVPGTLIFKSRLEHVPKALYCHKAKRIKVDKHETLKKLRAIFPDERSASCHS